MANQEVWQAQMSHGLAGFIKSLPNRLYFLGRILVNDAFQKGNGGNLDIIFFVLCRKKGIKIAGSAKL